MPPPTQATLLSGRASPRRTGPAATDDESIDALLARQLEYVLERSDFYRRSILPLRSRGSIKRRDFRHLPFTERESLSRSQDEHPPFGDYLAADPSMIARVHRTSGSGSQPLLIALSAEDVGLAVECGGECFQAAGVGPGDLIIHCLNYCLWSGGVTDHQALERSGAGVIPFGVGNTTELLRAIQRLKPTGIHCTPSYLTKLEDRLAREFHLAPSALGLRLGLFGGEAGLSEPSFRRRIESAWGFRAMDANYGMSEVLSIFGSECQARCGLHLFGQSAIHAELKSLDDDAVVPWEPGARGELVLTHLRRQCQPLVRYRTCDVIEIVSVDPCECGRASPRFRVIGRADDMVVIRGVNVYLGAIAEVIHAFDGPIGPEFRLLVSRIEPITDCIIKVEARGGDATQLLRSDVERALQDRLTLKVPVELVPAGALSRTNGKTRRLERVL